MAKLNNETFNDHPIRRTDFVRFMGAPWILANHKKFVDVQEKSGDGHANPQNVCSQCQTFALFTVHVANQVVTKRGIENRKEAIEYAIASVVTNYTKQIDVQRLAAEGLKKPYKTAKEPAYATAFAVGWISGVLKIEPAAAHRLLGEAIYMAQRGSSNVEAGTVLPFCYLAERLTTWEQANLDNVFRAAGWDSLVAIPEVKPWTASRVAHYWKDIVDACDRYPVAQSKLNDHVHSHSSNLNRQTVSVVVSSDEGGQHEAGLDDALENIDADPISGKEADSSFEGVADQLGVIVLGRIEATEEATELLEYLWKIGDRRSTSNDVKDLAAKFEVLAQKVGTTAVEYVLGGVTRPLVEHKLGEDVAALGVAKQLVGQVVDDLLEILPTQLVIARVGRTVTPTSVASDVVEELAATFAKHRKALPAAYRRKSNAESYEMWLHRVARDLIEKARRN